MSFHNAAWAKGLESLCVIGLKQIGGTGTASEVAASIGKPMNLVGPRFTALASYGKIKDTGKRSSAGRGRPSVVWTLCDASSQSAAVTDQADGEPGWFRRFGN